MKDLKAIKGKYYIADLISQGEHEHQDFKYAITDAPKIAHSISAFANNDGGRLLIGVKDNGVIAGVKNEEDIYVVEQAARMYCDPPQQPRFTAFATDAGTVIRVEIDKSPTRPVMCLDARKRAKAYYRVADENLPASPIMIKAWRARSDDGMSAGMFSDLHSAMLSIIDNRRGMVVEEAMKQLHISARAAEDAVVCLYSMGLVDFAYIDGVFRVISVEP